MRSPKPGSTTRRQFVQSLVGLGALVAPSLSSVGRLLAADPRSDGANRKLGIALVGLGGYSTGQLGPALQQTRYCRLAGVVTGTPSKGERWKEKYQLPVSSVYNYENFDRIADNPDIDIVYVVTPPGVHRDFVVRAAKAGKHVICEKPMATSVEDCDQMIAACKAADRQLSIGYRLHFEPHNMEAARLCTQKEFGAVKQIRAAFAFPGSGRGWRFDPKLSGGGPLMDVGIYCVQAALYLTGEEPVAITAKETRTDPERFKGIEETLHWTMEFPSGARADCVTSYNESHNGFRVEAEKGWIEVAPAFSYSGIQGRTSRGKMDFPAVNQQALQMDGFARSIMDGKPSIVPGEMGRRDIRLTTAIYEAMRSGKRVTV